MNQKNRLVRRSAPLVRRVARWWGAIRSRRAIKPALPYHATWREWRARDARHKRQLRGLRRLGWRPPHPDAWNLPR
jgi:hypothetical protein